MILKADASYLEWRIKVFLAQDKVAMQEILDGAPIHDDNQKAFGLSTKIAAKTFLYRMIFADAFGERGYNTPAYSYANDPEFMQTSSSIKFWEKVIEKFFEKYQGIKEHSINLIRSAIETGRIESPSGRFYTYHQKAKWDGSLDWPRTEILNHIVQGFSADIISEARLILWHRLLKRGYPLDKVLLINTVHDDIEIDIDNNQDLCYNICMEMRKAFQDTPKAVKKHYGCELNVPMDASVKFGWTLYEPEMVKFNSETFNEDWRKLNKWNFQRKLEIKKFML